MTFDPLLRYKEAYNTTSRNVEQPLFLDPSLPAPPFRESGKTLKMCISLK